VGIQSIDVQGATNSARPWVELGVRVVKRLPMLTVTLVNDYLEGRLAELNQHHLSDPPWLLVQPSSSLWWDQCSPQATAPVGLVLLIA
jgi:ribosomal protein S12 methylthiotransferase accessory factor